MSTELLIYTENYERGGGNKFLLNVLKILSGSFSEITVATNCNGIFYEEQKNLPNKVNFVELNLFSSQGISFKTTKWASDNIQVRRLILGLVRVFTPLIVLIQAIQMTKFFLQVRPKRVIVFNGGYPGALSCLVVTLISRLFTREVSISIVSMPTPYRGLGKFFARFVDKLVWKACTNVISNCKAIENSLEQSRGLPKLQTNKFIYTGLEDIPIFYEKYSSKKPSEDYLVLGYIGRIVAGKGIWLLVEAFIKLHEIYKNLKLEIYGEGEDLDKLIYKVSELNLDDWILVKGHYFGEISEVLNGIDIFVSPSYWEGLPYTIIEALRSGVVVVATEVGGTSEAITNGVNGILVPIGSSQSLFCAIESLINNSQLIEKLSFGARDTYLKKFSYKLFEEEIRDIFLC